MPQLRVSALADTVLMCNCTEAFSIAPWDFTRPLAELGWQAASEEHVVGHLLLHASK